MDKTIGRSLGNESLEENSCILEVPYIRAGGEPDQKTNFGNCAKSFVKKILTLT